MEVMLPFSIEYCMKYCIMAVVYLMGTFKWHTTVKALEHEFELFAYKSEIHVQATTISAAEYW